jgi:uncharacterized protein
MPPSDAISERIQSAAQLFRPDAATGIMRHSHGGRLEFFSRDLIRELHSAIILTYGDMAQDVLYRSGYEWALQEMAGLSRRMLAQFGVQSELWQLDPKFVLETWWAPMAESGWGAASFDYAPLPRSIVHVQVSQSVVADAFGRAEDPVCHLYAGLFAGALSFIERAERHAMELECRCQGASVCHFVAGPGAEVDTAETLRQQRIAPDEISRRMR